jgi:DNA-directed RNA polymerase alpha subunit
MSSSSKNLRICKKGHRYFKSSDCPTCPICEEERKPADGFLTNLSAPARRALENNHISTLQQLAQFSEKEILRFHGIGKSSIPKLKNALAELHLTFKDNTDE